MFRAIFSLIIRSLLTVFTACGIIHVCRYRLVSWMTPAGISYQILVSLALVVWKGHVVAQATALSWHTAVNTVNTLRTGDADLRF